MMCLQNDMLKNYVTNLSKVRKNIHLDKPGEMEKAIDILEEWIKKQKHFTKQKFDRHYLEYTIIMSKGSIERAKNKLDKSCTLKTMMPHLFVSFDLRYDFQEDLRNMSTAFLPKLTKDHNRVYIHRHVAQEFEPDVVLTFTRKVAMLTEYIRRYEYCISNVLIIDYRDINLIELMKRVTITEARQLAALLLECHCFRVVGIHILTHSKFIDLLLTIMKMVMSSKVADRINVHNDLESLHRVVEKDILPVEYGGKERPLKELSELWVDAIMSEEHQKYQQYMFSAKTNESMRQTDNFNDAYMGMPGTFRALMVD